MSVFNQEKFAEYTNYSADNPQKILNAWEVKEMNKTVRNAVAVRPIEIEKSILTRADGSVTYKAGKTEIICSVNGPLPSRDTRDIQKQLKGSVEVYAKFRNRGANEMKEENVIVSSLREIFSSVICLENFPGAQITLSLHILHHDGSLLSSCINAAMLACLDASVPCSKVVTSITVATELINNSDINELIVKEEETQGKKRAKIDTKPKLKPRLILDPNEVEEKIAHGITTFAFTNTHHILDINGQPVDFDNLKQVKNMSDEVPENTQSIPKTSTVEKLTPASSNMITCLSFGVWDTHSFLRSSDLARSQCLRIYKQFRETFNAIELN